MFKNFFPDEYFDSTYSINFKKLYDLGYKGIIFDIDNTLVKHDYPANAQAEHLFELLNDIGFKTCILSNNKEKRVTKFLRNIDSMYIYNAHKPLVANYIKAMSMMGTQPSNTLFVGDQIYTDLLGANKANIHTILVKPISSKEPLQIILKRIIEKPFLLAYKIKNKIK